MNNYFFDNRIFICSVLIFFVFPQFSNADQSVWTNGMWWVTESHGFLDVSKFDSGPQKFEDAVFYHKWIVENVDVGKTDNDTIYVVSIYPWDIPNNITNDHGNAYLFKLWLYKSDLSLKRIETNFRSGTYLVTGNIVSNRTIVYPGHQPAILGWASRICPLYFPIIQNDRTSLKEDALKNKIISVEDENTDSKIEQQSSVGIGKTSDEMLIELKIINTESTVRITEKWDRQCPWWLKWEKTNNPEKHGLWEARTIDWKGKLSEKNK